MAGDDDDLRINTLHRFAKKSPRLLLEEYSHCEVPAGCGGVVLRWIDRAAGLTTQLRVIGLRGQVWLDGTLVEHSRQIVVPGPHVLALELTADKPAVIALAFEFRDPERGREIVAAWRRAPARPPASWLEPGFDDAAWPPAPTATAAQLAALPEWSSIPEAIARGQHAVAIEAGTTWLRAHVEAQP